MVLIPAQHTAQEGLSCVSLKEGNYNVLTHIFFIRHCVRIQKHHYHNIKINTQKGRTVGHNQWTWAMEKRDERIEQMRALKKD